ncbi:PAP2 superfamily protein [mine drainage metagenome]|uniref:PAP2 superfamily protein n=1 Tax=mine drainage metagenome TaxID=410659 RepID=A0A1J5R905_9ZZZZ
MRLARLAPLFPKRLFLAACAVMLPLTLSPWPDLTVSGWFYRPGAGFYLRDLPLFRFILRDMPPLLLGGVALLLVWSLLRPRLGAAAARLPGLGGRAVLYLLLSLGLGPGLLVNALLKAHWGRARPVQITVFGGHAHYTPPLLPADQCFSNCSFSSGHGALGFWVLALALLTPPRLRRVMVALALMFGLLVGATRVIQGGHFLSDTVFSAFAVCLIDLWLWRWMLADPAA